jgi:hypothetical protein
MGLHLRVRGNPGNDGGIHCREVAPARHASGSAGGPQRGWRIRLHSPDHVPPTPRLKMCSTEIKAIPGVARTTSTVVLNRPEQPLQLHRAISGLKATLAPGNRWSCQA